METEIETEIEMELKNGKFFILENRSDEKNIKRYIYNGVKPAIDRIKEFIKTVNSDKLMLSTVDISSKNWNISGVPWSVIAMGLVRGDISKDLLDLDINSEKEKEKEKTQDASGQKKR